MTKLSIKRPIRVWGKFILQISLVVVLFIVALYTSVYLRDKELVREQALSSARAHFQNILLARQWNAAHGGVFVVKRPGVKAVPFLEHPDIQTLEGRVLTMRNPATMTREISELANSHGVFRYSITSLNPVNPANAPDDFERSALEQFKAGEDEVWAEETQEGKTYFRYMASLETTPECLECHAKQGYRVGDVRGGISVSFDISSVKAAMARNHLILLGLIVGTAGMVIAIFCVFAYRLMRRLHAAQEEIANLATTDELTGLANRRHFYSRLEEELGRVVRYETNLSLIMLDIDNFKRVNDQYGHPVGDRVLREVGRLLKANIRASDFAARYGGEEFAVLIPSLGVDEAARVAEKLRTVIEVNDLTMEGPSIEVTISAGVADCLSVISSKEELKMALIREADNALYRAKAEGRNRVEVYRKSSARQLSFE